MSNVTVAARPARRESINLITAVLDFAGRFAAAVRCANAVETRRKPAARDLKTLGLPKL